MLLHDVMQCLPYIFKNVMRKRLRSLLTIASVAIPLVLICVMMTLILALNKGPISEQSLFRLIVHHKVSLTNVLPEAYMHKVSQLPNVIAVTPFNWFGGQYIDATPKNMFARFSTDPQSFFTVFDDVSMVKGKKEDWLNDRTGTIVGESLMKKYGWRVGQKIPIKGDIYPANFAFTIQGVYHRQPDAAIFFHRKYIEETLPKTKGWVMSFWVKTNSAKNVADLTYQIDHLFENTAYPTKTESEKEFMNSFVSMLGNVKLLLSSITFIIAMVIFIITANSMAMSARERVVEVAVLKTLGFSNLLILSIILVESFILCAMGGIGGVFLFVLLFYPLKAMLITSPMGNLAAAMTLFPEVIGGVVLTIFMIGMGAGIIPAWRSSRQPIIESLRAN